MMKTRMLCGGLVAGVLAVVDPVSARQPADSVSGDYLEVRSCDVYTGPCIANGEMGLTGKEGILVWSIRKGSWKGTPLDGLSVIAVTHADGTLGDQRYEPRVGQAVLIVDSQANTDQTEALTEFVRARAGGLVREVVEVKHVPIEASIGACAKSGCAAVRAGNLVEISTRCLGDRDHLCGNEEAFYPPLTPLTQARPAFAELAAYKGPALNVTFECTDKRSAYIGTFVFQPARVARTALTYTSVGRLARRISGSP